MSDLGFPDAGWEAASREDLDLPASMVKAAAPFIVAAELRRLHREAARSDMETFDQLLRALWDRADELDGGAK